MTVDPGAGKHLCHLFTAGQDQLDVVASFVDQALELNEDVILVGDAELARSVAGAVRARPASLWGRPPLADRLTVWKPSVFLDADGRPDPQGFASRVLRAVDDARARGRNGVRLAVDMIWAAGSNRADEVLLEVEEGMDRLLEESEGGGSLCVLCQFDAERLPASAILAMLDHHSAVVVGAGQDYVADTDTQPNPILDSLRAKAERELVAKSVLYKGLFECTADGVAVFETRDGGRSFLLKDLNRAAEHLEGTRREHVIGRDLSEALPAMSAMGVGEVIRRVHAGGAPEHVELTDRGDGGGAESRECRVFGLPTGEVVVVYRDITERMLREEVLRRALEHLDALVRMCPLPVVSVDDQDRVIDWNPAAAMFSGWSAAEVLGKPIPWIPPGLEEEGRRNREHQLEGHSFHGDEFTRRRKDGSLFQVALYTAPFRDSKGNVVGATGVWLDVTQQRRAEAELKEREQRFRLLFQRAPVPYQSLGVDGCILEVNPLWLETLGYSETEVLGHWFGEFLVPEQRQLFAARFERFKEQGEAVVEYDMVRSDGSIINTSFVGRVAREVDGSFRQSHCIFTDITAQRRAQDALRRSEEKYRTLVEMAQEGIWVLDPEGRTTFANPFVAAMLGYLPQQMVGRSLAEFLHEDDAGLAPALLARSRGGLRDARECRYVSKDGITIDTVTSTTPLFEEDGRFVGMMAMVADLSLRRELDRERLRAAKLESLGTLAGGVAHDFNNLLTGIMGNISFAREVEDSAERQDVLQAAEDAAHRAVGLTKQLLTFAKGGAPVKHILSVRPLLEQSVSFVLSGSRVRADFRFGEACRVDVDPGQIAQVVQNLTLNAKEAMPDGGTLTVTTRDFLEEDGTAFVQMTFTDEGEGIAREHMDKLFDPYFTTKANGTGLGLAVVHSVVTRHGGYVEVESGSGGSSFHVFLPGICADAPATELSVGAGGRRTVRGRVLVVDDEAAVRLLLTRVLKDMGLEVVACGEGLEALAAYEAAERDEAGFDLVLTDLTMPGGMGGEELVYRISAIDPDALIVISSGYSTDALMSNHSAHGVAAALEKPYSVGTLRDLVSRLLADRF